MRKLCLFIVLFVFSLPSFASRGYVGNNPIKEIMLVEASSFCGPDNGACMVLFFEGGALGCSPSSDYISIRIDEPFYKSIEAMAFISLTTKKEFRTYATKESCADANLLSPNGASLYDSID